MFTERREHQPCSLFADAKGQAEQSPYVALFVVAVDGGIFQQAGIFCMRRGFAHQLLVFSVGGKAETEKSFHAPLLATVLSEDVFQQAEALCLPLDNSSLSCKHSPVTAVPYLSVLRPHQMTRSYSFQRLPHFSPTWRSFHCTRDTIISRTC